MPALFIYLIKVNIALVVFCLGYYAVLRHLTFYTLNRVYLVTAIVFSTLYPFINLSAFINRHQEIARPVQVVVINWQAPAYTLVQSVSRHNQWYWLQLIFWAGVLLFAVRLAIQLLSLYRLHKQSEPVQIRQYMIRVIKGDINPFSFWQNIYVNPANHPPHELDAILEHEQIHVNDWHTLDILLGEVSAIFYWFNPGIWLMKKAIRENIEFITDRKILQKGIDCKVYQYSLINVNFQARNNAIVNHFNISTIKKRIMMMNAKKSSSLNLTRYMFLVPAVIALLLVFSVSKAELNKAANNSTHLFNKAVKTVATKLNITNTVNTRKNAKLLKAASPNNAGTLLANTSDLKAVDTTYNAIYETTKADTGKNKQASVSGETLSAKRDTLYYTDKNGVIMAVPISGVVKKRTSGQSSQTTKVILDGITYTKDSMLPPVNKSVIVNGLVKPSNKITKMKLNGVTYTTSPNNMVPPVNKSVIVNGLVKPLSLNPSNKITKIKLNGVTYTYNNTKPKTDTLRAAFKNGSTKSVPDTLVIASVNKADKQLRIPFAVAKKVKGINKADTITGNDQQETTGRLATKIDVDRSNKVTKMRINGVTLNKAQTDSLLMATQNYKVDKDVAAAKFDKTAPQEFHLGPIKMSMLTGPIDFKNKLIIIDGKEATQKELKKLSADKIETINNITGDTATSKYGDKAKNGVITISTIKKN